MTRTPNLPPIEWDPSIPKRPLPPQGVHIQPQAIPGLLVIERSDPDVWVEWRRVCEIQARRPVRG